MENSNDLKKLRTAKYKHNKKHKNKKSIEKVTNNIHNSELDDHFEGSTLQEDQSEFNSDPGSAYNSINSKDFNLLSTSLEANYFQLKSEKQFIQECQHDFDFVDLFKLNLKQVGLAFSSVPLYESININSYLSEIQKNKLKIEAEKQLQNYNAYRSQIQSNFKQDSILSGAECDQNLKDASTSNQTIKNASLSNLKEKIANMKVADENEDLEDWLDEILST